MHSLLAALQELPQETLSFEALGRWVRQFPFDTLPYKDYLPTIDRTDDYSRNILTLEPLEAVLIYWPPEVRSAIHHHQGFYGYVVVLEGMLQDRTFTEKGDTLHEGRLMQAFAGGIIDEPDGVIHELGNVSPRQPAVTLHLYYPALETMAGMRIFDLAQQRVGVLNATAANASWANPDSAFASIQSNAFTYVPPRASHRMVVVQPKPAPDVIYRMLAEYYDEQAHSYDLFDLEHATRQPYTETINRLIGEDLCGRHTAQLLDVAVGTGRRALSIRHHAQCEYAITGVDMSAEMCAIARQRGIHAIHGRWLDVNPGPANHFDAVTFLYAFGHIATHALRVATLQKIYRHLQPGGRLYIDLFNAHDRHEWGPKALEAFDQRHLEKEGYERGDVFYQKTGGQAIAFVHYFTEEGVRQLLTEVGFRLVRLQYIGYVHRSGEVVDTSTDGFFFVIAEKPV